jgi:hypothetical protein
VANAKVRLGRRVLVAEPEKDRELSGALEGVHTLWIAIAFLLVTR